MSYIYFYDSIVRTITNHPQIIEQSVVSALKLTKGTESRHVARYSTAMSFNEDQITASLIQYTRKQLSIPVHA